MSTQQEGNPTQTKAILTMEEGGRIVLELDRAQAPLTTDNFVKLAQSGFYNGLIFHRVIPGFMIQGGCPDGTGMGGPGYQIKGEFSANGVANTIRHKRGVISMARAMHPDSAGSQFFIMHRDAPHLDGQYAAFGRVVEGLDVVDRIASVETGRQDRPVVAQKIASITIEVA
ncbi:MAG: peptidylprolyl isomerase [Eubacteriales bacterium]|nr:peptidylprolyl isomerase [Clostridiales bacterium]MDD2440897.1 peptidylprolyl isomerase [Eubacteriales bacterium]MDD4138601.1 peptidylprolyl isomerase [Eubacteriales bacterium]MDD4745035.1 peptidylprolyl isomerase [Eubacteriales bacterium]